MSGGSVFKKKAFPRHLNVWCHDSLSIESLTCVSIWAEKLFSLSGGAEKRLSKKNLFQSLFCSYPCCWWHRKQLGICCYLCSPFWLNKLFTISISEISKYETILRLELVHYNLSSEGFEPDSFGFSCNIAQCLSLYSTYGETVNLQYKRKKIQ